MKIVVSPDSFKGSMSAAEASDAIEKGILDVLSEVLIEKIPMADGGEGTVDALVASTNGRLIETNATDPLGHPVKGRYGILGDGTTAVIEMASVSGLPLVPEELRDPRNTTTYGTGELIREALDAGCREFVIGIGGSATNDCGTGMAQALGVAFYDADGKEITEFMRGGLLNAVAKIEMGGLHAAVAGSRFTVACDVDNPLLGLNGCAHIYAPQKGATPEIVEYLEKAMSRFIDVAESAAGRSVRNEPGAGAAGGLGAGLMAFLGAALKPGVEIVLDASRFAERIKGAMLIITGEGKLDRQTVFGKTIAGVTSEAKKQHIPVIAFAGKVEDDDALYEMGLKSFFTICDGPMPLAEAMEQGNALLRRAVVRAMRFF
ncbi:MAG: glycerate kinase [candidate division KSB1 bacterium]|jgi:glycerate kinase|nr:glycerate kinase [candidate division KSB1 bacterium]